MSRRQRLEFEQAGELLRIEINGLCLRCTSYLNRVNEALRKFLEKRNRLAVGNANLAFGQSCPLRRLHLPCYLAITLSSAVLNAFAPENEAIPVHSATLVDAHSSPRLRLRLASTLGSASTP